MDSTFFNNKEIITTVTHWKKYFLLSIALENKLHQSVALMIS